MLTRKQHNLLVYIDRHLRETGFSPSFEEMKNALNLKSKSGIHRLISSLEERGFLYRRHHRARALEVVRLPESMVPLTFEFEGTETPPPPSFTPKVIPGGLGKQPLGEEPGTIKLPLYGRIAAGLPIEALRDSTTQVEVPLALLGSGEHFALEVAGESMRDAGIQDGDIVIILRGETAETGQIVVALIDDVEVTLKRVRRKGVLLALEPANPAFETRYLPADRVKVQGRLVALLRRY